jgi:hypothetical protein
LVFDNEERGVPEALQRMGGSQWKDQRLLCFEWDQRQL